MRTRLLIILSLILPGLGAAALAQAPVDTIYNPQVAYSGIPHTYEIADIKVNGAENYEEYIIIGYSGLKVGDMVQVPGDDISDAAKRLWRQGLFGNVEIAIDKIAGDKV